MTKKNNNKENKETLEIDQMGALGEIDLDSELEDSLVEEDAIEVLPENYLEDDILYIPDSAIEYFKNKGYNLHWVRIFDPETREYDKGQIQKREQQGYVFLKRDEIPGLKDQMSSILSDAIKDDFGLYVVGHNALCKIPTSFVKARAAKKYQKIRERQQSVVDDLRRNNVMPNSAHGEAYKTTRTQPNKERVVNLGE